MQDVVNVAYGHDLIECLHSVKLLILRKFLYITLAVPYVRHNLTAAISCFNSVCFFEVSQIALVTSYERKRTLEYETVHSTFQLRHIRRHIHWLYYFRNMCFFIPMTIFWKKIKHQQKSKVYLLYLFNTMLLRRLQNLRAICYNL